MMMMKMMKSYSTRLVAVLVACTSGTSHAWSVPPASKTTTTTPTRQQFLHGFASAVAVLTTTTTSTPANAEFEPSTFNHQYNDPKHPNCKRIVVVKADGTAAVSGTDGTPGCPEDGSGNVWRLVGEVEGNKILVDFTAKVRTCVCSEE